MKAGKEEAEGRAAQLADQIARLEGQRSELQQQLATVGQEAAQLSSDAAAQAAALAALRDEMAAVQAEAAAKVGGTAVCGRVLGSACTPDQLALISIHISPTLPTGQGGR